MLFLNPQQVALNDLTLENVEAIAISRKADRLAIDYSDGGAYPVFADVPEQRITLTISRDLLHNDDDIADAAIPGAQFDLTFTTAPNASDANACIYDIPIIITAIEHALARSGRARQTITCLAISEDGETDPITPAPKGGPR